MKIGIQTWGSEGDINPFTPLHQAYQKQAIKLPLQLQALTAKIINLFQLNPVLSWHR
jgi:hypothetical protein